MSCIDTLLFLLDKIFVWKCSIHLSVMLLTLTLTTIGIINLWIKLIWTCWKLKIKIKCTKIIYSVSNLLEYGLMYFSSRFPPSILITVQDRRVRGNIINSNVNPRPDQTKKKRSLNFHSEHILTIFLYLSNTVCIIVHCVNGKNRIRWHEVRI